MFSCIQWRYSNEPTIAEKEQELALKPAALNPQSNKLFVQLLDKDNFVAKFVFERTERNLQVLVENEEQRPYKHSTYTYLAQGIYAIDSDAIYRIQKVVFSELDIITQMPKELSDLVCQYYDPALDVLTQILRSTIDSIYSTDLRAYPQSSLKILFVL